MGLLSGLFQSDTMKEAAFGMVKKMLNDGNYKYLVIKMEDNGELGMDTYTHEQEPVIMSKQQINDLQAVIDGLQKTQENLQVERLLDENERLIRMCSEQERHITELMKPGNDAVRQAYIIGRSDGISGVARDILYHNQTPENGSIEA